MRSYSDLELALYKYTDGFTKPVGKFPLTSKDELENAIDILKKYYAKVGNRLDFDRESADEGTVDYQVVYESLKDGGIEMTNEKSPSLFNSLGGFGEDLEMPIKETFDVDLEEKLTLDETPDDRLNEGLEEDIEKHDELNPAIWEDNELRPEVKEKLEDIVDKFLYNLRQDGIELTVKDILLLGSNANYNYTKDSDIDLHIIADLTPYKDTKDLAMKLYDARRKIFNDKYDPLIRGFEVELYVEPAEDQDNNDIPDAVEESLNEAANSNGVYSLFNGWIKQPVKDKIPDEINLEPALTDWVERSYTCETIDDIDSYIDELYILRQEGLLNGGEYSAPNLIFKEIRNRGILQDLRDKKVELENKEMSLESLQEDVTSDTTIAALKDYFNTDDIEQLDDLHYRVDDGEYLVCNHDVAEEEAKQYTLALLDDIGLQGLSKDYVNQLISDPVFIDTDKFERIILAEIPDIWQDDRVMAKGLLKLLEAEDWEELMFWYGWPDNFNLDIFDMDAIAEDIVASDGIANSLASYDGEEHGLANNLYAYRQN